MSNLYEWSSGKNEIRTVYRCDIEDVDWEVIISVIVGSDIEAIVITRQNNSKKLQFNITGTDNCKVFVGEIKRLFRSLDAWIDVWT